jgi:heme oxygenase
MTLQTLESRPNAESGRATRLKAATHSTHERLDRRIMSADPFASRDRYASFLNVQYEFHCIVDIVYARRDFLALIPDLAARRRLDLIRQDIADLGGTAPIPGEQDRFLVDGPNALGWLYVAEGSNLGAAFLLKEAAKLGLSESFGARHLAAAPEGRGLHWKTFTAALDAVELKPEEEACAVAGAKQAFALVQNLVERAFP